MKDRLESQIGFQLENHKAVRPNSRSSYLILKAFMDWILALTFLIILSPLFLIIGIYLSFRFWAFPIFTQSRIGKDQCSFTIFKFRTLPVSWSEKSSIVLSRDLKFLRDSGVDELPQLLNILGGKMSFVGPRPLLPEYLRHFSPKQLERHNLKPGITGLAQVKGGNLLSWRDRLRWDIMYVRKCNWVLDFKILVWTILSPARKDQGIFSEAFNGSN